MNANELPTFWILFGKHEPTMTLEQLRAEFFPGAAMKTMRNKAASRQLPSRTGEVFDVRDVADWWDGQRKASAA